MFGGGCRPLRVLRSPEYHRRERPGSAARARCARGGTPEGRRRSRHWNVRTSWGTSFSQTHGKASVHAFVSRPGSAELRRDTPHPTLSAQPRGSGCQMVGAVRRPPGAARRGLACGVGLALVLDEAVVLISLEGVYGDTAGGVSIASAVTVIAVAGSSRRDAQVTGQRVPYSASLRRLPWPAGSRPAGPTSAGRWCRARRTSLLRTFVVAPGEDRERRNGELRKVRRRIRTRCTRPRAERIILDRAAVGSTSPDGKGPPRGGRWGTPPRRTLASAA